MSYDETLLERISAGFISDTREGRKQSFFAWFDANKDYDNFDGHEAQRREQLAGVTQADWREYHESFRVEF